MSQPLKAIRAVDRLADRFLDPRRPFTLRHDEERRALCAQSPEVARRWHRRLALHRALAGAERASGLEDRRNAALVVARALGADGGQPATSRPSWRGLWWVGPLLAAGLALLVTQSSDTPIGPNDAWIASKGFDTWSSEPVVGFGVGGLSEDGSEYEIAVTAEAAGEGRALVEGDWIRLSYTNEREDLRWLFLVAVREGGIVWLAPSPDEARSVAIGLARHRVLEVEAMIPAKRGDLIAVLGVFSGEPVSVEAMRAALEGLPEALSSTGALGLDSPASAAAAYEDHLRARLPLATSDVVQVATTRVAPPAPRAAPRIEDSERSGEDGPAPGAPHDDGQSDPPGLPLEAPR